MTNPDSAANARPAREYGDAQMQCEATELMTAAKRGDVTAFETLSTIIRGRAFQLAHSLVGSREDALDLCQEAFMKAFRARGTYDPGQPFLPWFHRILRNTCFSFLRQHRRLKAHTLSPRDADAEQGEYEIIDEAPSPDANLLADERESLFRQALATLSARDREILVLRHFEDLAYKEIADNLGIPEGTVMSRLFHARRRLREVLGPLLEESIESPAGSPRGNPQGRVSGAASGSAKRKERAL